MTLRAIPYRRSPTLPVAHPETLAAAKAIIQREAAAVAAMAERLNGEFCAAVDLILRCQGRVIVSGVGKSGLIGRKIASTLACTGTPSFFLHPVEAAHGDLGVVTSADVVVLVSNSGETEEVLRLVPYLNENDVPIIALVGRAHSVLARRADVALDIATEREACPHNLVPTSSALTTLAMGDALALAVMHVRGFQPADFARVHPGGSLGRRRLVRVRDAMVTDSLPLLTPDQSLAEGMVAMGTSRCGMAVVVALDGTPLGTILHTDLAEAFASSPDPKNQPVTTAAMQPPEIINENATLDEATERMEREKLAGLVVIDAHQRVSGIVVARNER